jgi:hypothetical protein
VRLQTAPLTARKCWRKALACFIAVVVMQALLFTGTTVFGLRALGLLLAAAMLSIATGLSAS